MSRPVDGELALDAKLMTSNKLPISNGKGGANTAMTIKRYYILAYAFFYFFAGLGCVSIGMQKPKTQKSDTVACAPPTSPFFEGQTVLLDRVWRNTKNGSTISYLSDCNNPTDPSLQNIFKGVTSEIENVAVIESSQITYNQREALHSIVEGNVDGVLTRFELLIFKKNNCTYILTYAAVATVFSENQKHFQTFVKGFSVL